MAGKTGNTLWKTGVFNFICGYDGVFMYFCDLELEACNICKCEDNEPADSDE